MSDDLHLQDECPKCGEDISVEYDEDNDYYEMAKREAFLQHAREEHPYIFKVSSGIAMVTNTVRRFISVVFR